MFTITTQIRGLIAIGAIGAALASSGAAAGRSVHHHPGTGKPVAVRTIAASRTTSHVGTGGPVIVGTKPTTSALDAGSAGIDGYDDATCGGLAKDYNRAVNAMEAGILAGDDAAAATYGNLANRIMGQMSDNCLVVY